MTVTERAVATEQETEHVDVLIVGAGISGIGAAHHLRERFPGRSFVVLDALEDRGGTWWTHRYPGARSDSDLFTFGYRLSRGAAPRSRPPRRSSPTSTRSSPRTTSAT
jgi:monooxygenase